MIDRGELTILLEGRSWTFAKTMPSIPHFWSVSRDWPDREIFREAVEGIDHYGVLERFRTFKPKKYFYGGGFRYWIMSPPHEATLINRCDPQHPWIRPHIRRLG